MKKMTTDPKMLELLVCPLTGESLSLNRETQELISHKAKLAYPIRDGVPIMLASEARPLQHNEKAMHKK
ncbi:Trm112 family protein [Bartonella taylorii]|uniref:Trm112 family protein n=1 Tax=Bartonella taylorii TaxID=33046 RepID=UPI001ABA61A4|nr:Trm112 family protein [Bartonella taylorii]